VCMLWDVPASPAVACLVCCAIQQCVCDPAGQPRLSWVWVRQPHMSSSDLLPLAESDSQRLHTWHNCCLGPEFLEFVPV
jgi:hypothetical protein